MSALQTYPTYTLGVFLAASIHDCQSLTSASHAGLGLALMTEQTLGAHMQIKPLSLLISAPLGQSLPDQSHQALLWLQLLHNRLVFNLADLIILGTNSYREPHIPLVEARVPGVACKLLMLVLWDRECLT